MLAWEGTAWAQTGSARHVRSRTGRKSPANLGFKENNFVADIHAVQLLRSGDLGEVEPLGGNHAGDDGCVSLAGPHPENDAILRLGKTAHPHQAFIADRDEGIGWFAPFPDFDSLDLDDLFRRAADRVGVLGRGGSYGEEEQEAEALDHPFTLSRNEPESSRDFPGAS